MNDFAFQASSGNRAVVVLSALGDSESFVAWRDVPSQNDINDFNETGRIEIAKMLSRTLYGEATATQIEEAIKE